MTRLVLALLVLAALGCGTGTDGKPVAPPTTPAPASAPLPPPPSPDPPACADERERAAAYQNRPLLVHEWDPERPFPVWVDEEAIRKGGGEIDDPNFLEEQVLAPLREVAKRLKDRLGYTIFDPDYLLSARPANDDPAIKVRRLDDLAQTGPPWDENCAPATHPPISAANAWATVFYNDFFTPAVTCPAFQRIRKGKTIVHELTHLFGMKHAASTGDANSKNRGGVHMSRPLTGTIFFSEADILTEDLDNIGCIFPHPDHPR